MPKAQKLASGNWRVRVFTHTDPDGKKHYKSFTAPTKKEAEYMASSFYLDKDASNSATGDMTLRQAFERYISSVEGVLSPSTVNQYEQQMRCYLKDVMPMKLSNITNEMLQKAISKEAEHLAPKTVKNISGLLSKVLKTYRKDFRYDVVLPQKEKKELYIPTEEEVKAILDYTEKNNDPLFVPVLLASTLGLRRSEVVGLKWDCVDFKEHTINIKQAVVRGRENKYYKKKPKSYAGYRTLRMPEKLEQALLKERENNKSDTVVSINPKSVSDRFRICLNKLNIPHFRFHDLRHYIASVMLSMNVPNKYAAARMGHATEDMLKNVYQHLMEKKKNEVDNQMTDYFNNFFE